MKLFNTMSGTKEEFVPLEPGKVKMYACGPTVYNLIHIGNARPLCTFDALRRYLEWRGYEVTFVQNFTDVDDKIIRRANEEGISSAEVAEKYIAEFRVDAEGLNVRPATIAPRATETMDAIIALVQRLIDRGFAYEAGGDVYFEARRFKEYGKLSKQPLDDLEAGARVESGEQKRDPMDFALWKAAKPGEPFWESPWGPGRPGWHIECSAMVGKHLGDTIDIHGGGKDLVFPHHENEIAQSECATGKPFAHYWLHNGFISVDNRKMSKSLNNFFTVRDVANEYGYEPIRFLMLASHYRSPINYSVDIIRQNQSALERLYSCRDNLEFITKNAAEGPEDPAFTALLAQKKQAFIDAMDDDFNTADAVSVLFELAREINIHCSAAAAPSRADCLNAQKLYSELTDVLGLLYVRRGGSDDAQIEELVAQRTAAKKARDYQKADAIRAQLKEMGVTLEDTPQGTKWSRA